MEPSSASQTRKDGDVRMSHFSVGVICESLNDVERLLAPYDENIEVEQYVSRTKAEIIEEGKNVKRRLLADDKDEYTSDEWALKYLSAETDEDFYNAERYADSEYDKDGNELTTYNPKSKWDWYSIGGRWSGELRLKEEDEDRYSYCDGAKIKDIDFSPDKEKYDECYKWWKEKVEGSDEEWDSFYKKSYFTERYRDAEEYATRSARFTTFALVTPDGEWHEQGEMGWFGCSTETPEEAREWDEQYISFIENADPEYYFVMVDCHI